MERLFANWPLIAGALTVFCLAVSPLLPLEGLRLVLLLTLLGGSLYLSRLKGELAGWLSPWALWAPWLLWAALSCLWSLEPDYSAYYWLNEVLPSALCFALGAQLARQGMPIAWMAGGLVLMAVVPALVSAAHLLWPQQVPLYYPGWLDNEPQATAYLVLPAMAAAWWLLRVAGKGFGLALLTFVAIELVAWVAFKRSPYLALLVQLAVMMLFTPLLSTNTRSRWRFIAVLGVCLLVSALLAHFVGQGRPASYAAGAPSDTGMVAAVQHNERYDTWRFWWQEGSERMWLGTGVGRYLPNHAYVVGRQLNVDPWFVVHAHNIFLNQWLQLGVPGVLAFAWLWLALSGHLLRGLTAKNCQQVRILSALAFAALLSMLIRNGTDDLLYGSCGAAWWLPMGYFWFNTGTAPRSSPV